MISVKKISHIFKKFILRFIIHKRIQLHRTSPIALCKSLFCALTPREKVTPLREFVQMIISLYSRGSEFIRLPCPYRTVPYRTVPYRFPWGTVLVDRAAYRTFLTVFRDFCLKARTLPRFKFYRSSFLTLIFRKSANRTVPKHWPFFVILKIKTLIWWNLLEKREPYRDANFKFSRF